MPPFQASAFRLHWDFDNRSPAVNTLHLQTPASSFDNILKNTYTYDTNYNERQWWQSSSKIALSENIFWSSRNEKKAEASKMKNVSESTVPSPSSSSSSFTGSGLDLALLFVGLALAVLLAGEGDLEAASQNNRLWRLNGHKHTSHKQYEWCVILIRNSTKRPTHYFNFSYHHRQKARRYNYSKITYIRN